MGLACGLEVARVRDGRCQPIVRAERSNGRAAHPPCGNCVRRRGRHYIGPDRFIETWGHPQKVQSSGRSRDREVAARLWDLSQKLTGVSYAALGPQR